MTFLSSLFTKTQEAPFVFMQVIAQLLCAAFAPFAPQELSLTQPVQVIVLLSAMVARVSVANNTASKPNVPIALFMFTSSSELQRAAGMTRFTVRPGKCNAPR